MNVPDFSYILFTDVMLHIIIGTEKTFRGGPLHNEYMSIMYLFVNYVHTAIDCIGPASHKKYDVIVMKKSRPICCTKLRNKRVLGRFVRMV